MESLFDLDVPFENATCTFMDLHGEVMAFHLLTQRCTQVVAIEFRREMKRIPTPDGVVVSTINLKTGLVSVFEPDKNSVTWFHYKHAFRVQYYNRVVLVMIPK